jgi:archaellum component FlaC
MAIKQASEPSDDDLENLKSRAKELMPPEVLERCNKFEASLENKTPEELQHIADELQAKIERLESQT